MNLIKKFLNYHLKAKTHIICNMHYQSGNYKGDIMGCLSFGALKINLWHGIGVKATGYLRKDISHRKKKMINFLEQINSCFFTPGSWKNAYFLATSEENKRVLENDNGIEKNKIIVSTYPRHCKYQFYLQNEKKIRNEIIKYSNNGWKIILFAPTFRNKYFDKYIYNPIENEKFVEFLLENRILWIQSTHLATNKEKDNNISNVINIDSELDTSSILPLIDILISDYSSITTDAIILNKITIDYIPDYDYYIQEDRGFVGDYSTYHPGLKAYNLKELKNAIVDLKRHKDVLDLQLSLKKKLCIKENDIDIITNDIINLIKK